MREHRGTSDLALEASQSVLSGPVGQEELDGGGPAKHRVRGAVDHAHPAFAELLLERVLSEPPNVAHRLAQTIDRLRKAGRHGHDDRPQDGGDERRRVGHVAHLALGPDGRGRIMQRGIPRAERDEDAAEQRQRHQRGDHQRVPRGGRDVDRVHEQHVREQRCARSCRATRVRSMTSAIVENAAVPTNSVESSTARTNRGDLGAPRKRSHSAANATVATRSGMLLRLNESRPSQIEAEKFRTT